MPPPCGFAEVTSTRGTKRKAEASEEHRKRHCPEREEVCEVAGCGMMCKLGTRAEHMKEHAEQHVVLLAAENKVRVAENKALLERTAVLERAVCNLESRCMATCVSEWIVDGFSAKRLAQQQVCSGEMVMSHEHVAHRYPFQLGMHPNGKNNDGVVGLFFGPRRGEHPHRLEWPMKKKVEVRVVNQKGGNDKVIILDPVNDDGDKAFFSKHAPPAADAPPAAGRGCPNILNPSAVDDFVTSTDCMTVRVQLLD